MNDLVHTLTRDITVNTSVFKKGTKGVFLAPGLFTPVESPLVIPVTIHDTVLENAEREEVPNPEEVKSEWIRKNGCSVLKTLLEMGNEHEDHYEYEMVPWLTRQMWEIDPSFQYWQFCRLKGDRWSVVRDCFSVKQVGKYFTRSLAQGNPNLSPTSGSPRKSRIVTVEIRSRRKSKSRLRAALFLHLSGHPIRIFCQQKKIAREGFEPSTSRLRGVCSAS